MSKLLLPTSDWGPARAEDRAEYKQGCGAGATIPFNPSVVSTTPMLQVSCCWVSAQWFETVWNRLIQFKDINLFPMSSGASERMNAADRAHERSGACERSEQSGASE